VSQAPAAERSPRSGRHIPKDVRRDELADALFGYINGLKRRLMASVLYPMMWQR